MLEQTQNCRKLKFQSENQEVLTDPVSDRSVRTGFDQLQGIGGGA